MAFSQSIEQTNQKRSYDIYGKGPPGKVCRRGDVVYVAPHQVAQAGAQESAETGKVCKISTPL